jgi:hypothetical protein
MLQFPPLPDIPEPVRGRSFSVVEAAYLGDEADGAELMAPLRALGPEMDSFATIPAAGLAGMHMDPPEPVPAITDHRMIGELPSEGIDALLEATGPGSGSPLLSVELRHCGGALARSGEDHGAVDTLRGEYAMFGVGVPMSDELAAASREAFSRVGEALAPYDSGRPYANFVERPADTARMFEDGVIERLSAVRAERDPEGVFRANHVVEAAAA